MRSSTLLIGGLAVGAGAVLIWRRNSRPQPTPTDVEWSAAERIAVGVAGGGLMYYGTRSKGKLARVAAVAGAGLLARSVQDQPVQKLSDVINPRALLTA